MDASTSSVIVETPGESVVEFESNHSMNPNESAMKTGIIVLNWKLRSLLENESDEVSAAGSLGGYRYRHLNITKEAFDNQTFLMALRRYKVFYLELYLEFYLDFYLEPACLEF